MAITTTFEHACASGNIKKAKRLLNKLENKILNPKFYFARVLYGACLNNHQHIAVWLANSVEIDFNEYEFYYGLCQHGNLEFMQCLMQLNVTINHEKIFATACYYGSLNVAKHIHAINPSVNVFIDKGYAYNYACRNGHLHVAQWLIDTFGFCSLFYNNVNTFIAVCENGHLHVAQWLLTVQFNIKQEWVIQSSFISACENGHLPVATWLLTIWENAFPIKKIYIISEFSFAKICKKGYLNIAQWLFSLSSVKIILSNAYYVYALSGNNIHIAKWILATMPTTTIAVEHAFIAACKSGALDAAKWIYYKNPDINIELDQDVFEIICSNNNYKLLKWLLNLYKTRGKTINTDYIKSCLRGCCLRNRLNILQVLVSEIPNINICYDGHILFQITTNVHISKYLQRLYPFKYSVKKTNIVRKSRVSNMLFMLYVLHKKGHANNLTPNIVLLMRY